MRRTSPITPFSQAILIPSFLTESIFSSGTANEVKLDGSGTKTTLWDVRKSEPDWEVTTCELNEKEKEIFCRRTQMRSDGSIGRGISAFERSDELRYAEFSIFEGL